MIVRKLWRNNYTVYGTSVNRFRHVAEPKLSRRELVHQVTGNSAMPRKKGCG